MVKKILLVLFCLISLVIFVSTLHAQSPKKTITLPNGEVIVDLNGEWDSLHEHYGDWSQFGSGPNILKITQQGSSFEGEIMIATYVVRKGAVYIKGELDKNGFRKVQLITPGGMLDSKGQISDDGNKIIVDDGARIKVTLTRK